jgi:hypothetical protein
MSGSDAALPLWAGNPASVRLVKEPATRASASGSASNYLPFANARRLPERGFPGEPINPKKYDFGQKNPSVATFKGKPMSIKLFGTPAPASTMSLQLMLLPPASCSRGQVGKGYFANSPSKLAIRWPTVNDL